MIRPVRPGLAIGLSVLLALTAVSGCIESRSISVEIGPDTLRLDALGDSVEIPVTVADDGATVGPNAVLWFGGADTVAVVNDAGWVRSVGEGTTTVYARRGGGIDSVVVRVDQAVAFIAIDRPADARVSGSLGDTVAMTIRGLDRRGNPVPDAAFQVESADSFVARPLADARVALEAWGSTDLTVAADSAARVLPVRVGFTWTELDAGVGSEIEAVWIRDASALHAGLADGRIATYTGGATTTMDSGCSAGPESITSTGDGGAIGVNWGGCVFWYDGVSWALDPDPPLGPLTHAVGAPAAAPFVTGWGTIYRHDGTSWDAESVPVALSSRSTRTAWAARTTTVFVGGSDGLLLRWNGGGWFEVAGVPAVDIDHVWGHRPDSMYVAGSTVWLWDGATWTELDAPPPRPTTRVAPGDGGFFYATGAGVYFLRDGRASRLPDAAPGRTLDYHPEYGLVVAVEDRLYRGVP